MNARARHTMFLASFIVVIVLVGALAIALYPSLAGFMSAKQTVLIVNPGGGTLKIADTWIQGNFTTDSGTSDLRTEQQAVYAPQSILSSILPTQTINTQGTAKYDVKTITYSYKDVAKFLGIQVDLLVYRVQIDVQVEASQVNGTGVYKLNGPSNVVTSFTWQAEGQVQVPIGGITDVTAGLKAANAPYGTYLIKVTATESWSLWAFNMLYTTLILLLGPNGIGLLTTLCWVQGKPAGDPSCYGLTQAEGPSITVLQEQTGNVIYGQVNTPTFYMELPNTPIAVGTQTGHQKAFDIAFLPAGGFTGNVHLTFTGLPSAMTIDNQDHPGQVDFTLPASPVTFIVTVNQNTKLGNYTITATASSGTITRQGTFMVQVVQNGGGVQCPPICNQENTILAADTDKTAYAPYDIVKVNGALTSASGAPVNAGEIDITDTTTGKVLAKAATGTDGKFTATFLAPSSAGDYALTVSYPGDLTHYPSSATVKYSVNNLPPIMLYIIIAVIAAIVIIGVGAALYFTRRKPGGMP